MRPPNWSSPLPICIHTFTPHKHTLGRRRLPSTLSNPNLSSTRPLSFHGARAQVFAFSSENWGRGQREVTFLLSLFGRVLAEEAPALARAGVRLRVVGDRARLPAALVRQIQQVRVEWFCGEGGGWRAGREKLRQGGALGG
eukprot:354422-Chlamydomonas_euryale.AAC.4